MTTLTVETTTITELYAARAAGETTTAMLTDGRDILDISRNDDGTYHLWTNLGEVSSVAGERMVIAPPARTITKEITYNRLTKDYDMTLNGEYIGSERSYHSAEVELDRLAYEQLDRAGVEPELLLTATALDGGSDQDEIAAEYAEALPKPCATCGSDGSPCVDCNPAPADHNLVTPDPNECPDVSAPQPCKDCPTCFILPSGDVVQSVILCVGGVSRVVSACGVAEALALASVHQVTR